MFYAFIAGKITPIPVMNAEDTRQALSRVFYIDPLFFGSVKFCEGCNIGSPSPSQKNPEPEPFIPCPRIIAIEISNHPGPPHLKI